MTSLGVIASAAIVVLLVIVASMAFQERTAAGQQIWTLANLRQTYQDPFVYRTLLNTVGFTLVVVAVSMLLALPIAWLIERTTLPAKSLVFSLMAVSVLIPSFFPAMGWQFLLHPRIGLFNHLLTGILPIERSPLNVSGVVGMGFVQGLSLIPLAFIMIAPAFRNMDPTLEESARIHTLGMWRRMQKITLPLMWPSILAAGLYVMAIGIGAFDVPAFLGMAGGTYTLSTFIYVQARPEDAVPNYGIVSAASLLLMLVALVVSVWYLKTIQQSHRYQVVSGKAYRPSRIELKRWTTAAWAYIAFVVLLTLVVPLLMLVWAAVTPFLMVPSLSAFSMATMKNFSGVTGGPFWGAFRNTAILVIGVPTVTAVFGLAISWVTIRSRIRLAGVFDIVSFMPHVVPNVIFAVGALLVVLFWLPVWVPLYGSVALILLVSVIVRIPFATRMYNSALLQINKELDEAGYISGLGPLSVVWRILRPLLTPALLYSWLWMALLAYRELTVAALLTTRGNVTMPVYIWAVWQGGQLNQAAAASLVTFLVVLPLIVVFLVFGRRILPWR